MKRWKGKKPANVFDDVKTEFLPTDVMAA